MKKIKFLFVLFSLFTFLQSFALAGHEGGNGGDPVRLEFIDTGKKILKKYDKKLRLYLTLDQLEELKQKLSIEFISLTDQIIIDNGGSVVSAIGDQSGIVLYVGSEYPDLSWSYLLKNRMITEKLILHEMFRLVGLDDDNYIYTNKVILNSGYVNLNQIIELTKNLRPISISDMMSKGLRYDLVSQSSCGLAEGYQVSLVTRLSCSEKDSKCTVQNIWTQQNLFQLNFEDNKKNREFFKAVTSKNAKAVLSCDYKRDIQEECQSLSKTMITKYNCNLLLSDHLNFDGKLKTQKLEQQQRQQRQQQQQQQQVNRLK